MNYTADFSGVAEGYESLLEGLLVTLKLTLAANLIGISLGFMLALLVMSKMKYLSTPAMLFVEFFRCTPVMIQIVWFFYCVPIIFDLYLSPLTMGILALGLNLTAFNAEAYRAAIQSVPKEQYDAAIALGLKPVQRVMYIVFPHAIRSAIPVLMTNGIGSFQQTALVAMVAVQDLMYQAKYLATNTYRPIETFTVVALVYFVISFAVAQLVQFIEHKQALATR